MQRCFSLLFHLCAGLAGLVGLRPGTLRRAAAALAAVLAADVLPDAGAARVWCDRWRPGAPTLAVAMPRMLHERLLAPAAAGQAPRWRLESVRPWWNPSVDALLDRTRPGGGSIGWSLGEPDGMIVGRAVAGRPVELAFEAAKRHDPDWSLLRRRLAANWHDVDAIEHLDFARAAAAAAPVAIGAARAVEPAGAPA